MQLCEKSAHNKKNKNKLTRIREDERDAVVRVVGAQNEWERQLLETDPGFRFRV